MTNFISENLEENEYSDIDEDDDEDGETEDDIKLKDI